MFSRFDVEYRRVTDEQSDGQTSKKPLKNDDAISVGYMPIIVV